MHKLADAIDTRNATSLTLRLTLATIMWPHGAQKVLGWFGGFGFDATMTYFTDTVGIPWILGAGVVAIEFLGPLLLLVGLGTRITAVLFSAVMLGAITAGGHHQYGFFLDWFGNQSGEGIEFHLLMIGSAVALATLGPGRLSADSALQSAPR